MRIRKNLLAALLAGLLALAGVACEAGDGGTVEDGATPPPAGEVTPAPDGT